MSRSVCRRIARYDAARVGVKYRARALARIVAEDVASGAPHRPSVVREAARLSARARAALMAQLAALGVGFDGGRG